MKRFVLSRDADVDLQEIGEYISIDNPARAITFVEELIAKAKQTVERPQSFPLKQEAGVGIRSALYRDYLILFDETDEEVRILRIVSGRRDLQTLRIR